MTRILAFCILVLSFSTTIDAADKARFVGHYWNAEKDGIIKLHLNNDGVIEGVTAWGKTNTNDTKNPDPKLRDRPIKGITFLWGFSYDAKKNRWVDGKVYDPKSGKTYTARLSLENDGKILKMRGYIGVPMFGRTAKFTRITEGGFPDDFTATLDD